MKTLKDCRLLGVYSKHDKLDDLKYAQEQNTYKCCKICSLVTECNTYVKHKVKEIIRKEKERSK